MTALLGRIYAWQLTGAAAWILIDSYRLGTPAASVGYTTPLVLPRTPIYAEITVGTNGTGTLSITQE